VSVRLWRRLMVSSHTDDEIADQIAIRVPACSAVCIPDITASNITERRRARIRMSIAWRGSSAAQR
jgi:hypothetical protein